MDFILRRTVLVCLSAVVWTLPSTTPSFPQGSNAEPGFFTSGKLDLDKVVAHFEDLYRSKSSISTATLIITKPRRTKTMTLTSWTRGRDKALIVVQSPAREKGTATLKVDQNLWNYLPRINRTVRIPPSMMLGSWMGSDFTNDDLVRESSFTEDYFYELVGTSEDPEGWLIRFTAKPDMVGLWNRFDWVVSKDGSIPVQAKYYDRKDRLARTITWEDVRLFDGRKIPAKMTLLPEGEEGQQTVMIYEEIDFDGDVPASTFSLSTLEQER